jgi:hypothetical protein
MKADLYEIEKNKLKRTMEKTLLLWKDKLDKPLAQITFKREEIQINFNIKIRQKKKKKRTTDANLSHPTSELNQTEHRKDYSSWSHGTQLKEPKMALHRQ